MEQSYIKYLTFTFTFCMLMEIEGTRQMKHLKEIWRDCVKGDMDNIGLSCENAQDKDQWRQRIRGD